MNTPFCSHRWLTMAFFVFAIGLSVSGCQSTLPKLQTIPKQGHVTPMDVMADVNCELATIMSMAKDTSFLADPSGAIKDALDASPRYSDAYRQTLQRMQKFFNTTDNVDGYPGKTSQYMAGLLSNLATSNFVAAVQLNIEVTDSEGFSPTWNQIQPYRGGMSNRTEVLGLQLSGTQDRTMTLTSSIDLALLLPYKMVAGKPVKKKLPPVQEYCPKISTLPHPLIALGKTTGLNGALLGDLGLADIVINGVQSLDAVSYVNVYGGTGPSRPAQTAQVDMAILTPEDPKTGKAESEGSFSGSLIFTPPSSGTSTPETATLIGLLTLTVDVSVHGKPASNTFSYFVNIPGTVVPKGSHGNSTSQSRAAYLILQGGITSDVAPKSNAGSPGITPTLILSGESADGRLDGMSLDGQLIGTTNSYAFTAIVSRTKDAATQLEQKPEVSSQISQLTVGAILPTGSSPQGGVSQGAGTAGVGKPAGAAGATSAGSTSFGSTVDFTLVWGLNGGPTWTLKHRKGPAPTNPLVTASRTEFNTMNITFVAACHDQEDTDSLIADAPKTYWDTLPPCDTDNISIGNAAAAANQLNLLLRIH